VALGGCVPVSAGLAGVLTGGGFLETPLNAAPDSHLRYLSGLLLAIGIGFWSTIPRIAEHGARFGLLTGIVVAGGLARLLAVPLMGWPGGPMAAALLMELVVTPGLFLWQRRVAGANRA
jgi:hypothetical protein